MPHIILEQNQFKKKWNPNHPFIHFTTEKNALNIIKQKKILNKTPDAKKFGPEGIYAVSLWHGHYVPEVQITHINKMYPNEKIVGVVFKTNEKPTAIFPEEAFWRKEALSIRFQQIVTVNQAKKMLARVPDPLDADTDDPIVYEGKLLAEIGSKDTIHFRLNDVTQSKGEDYFEKTYEFIVDEIDDILFLTLTFSGDALDVFFGFEKMMYRTVNIGTAFSLKVLNTVTYVVKDFIKRGKYDIKRIIFYTSGTKAKGSRNQGRGAEIRKNLYFYFIKKYFPNAEMKSKGKNVEILLNERSQVIGEMGDKMLPFNLSQIEQRQDEKWIDKVYYFSVNDYDIENRLIIELTFWKESQTLDVEFNFENMGYEDTPNKGYRFAMEVMASVVFAVKDFIAKIDYDVKKILFASEKYKTTNSKNFNKADMQRNKLYLYFIKKYFPNATVEKGNDGIVEVTLNKDQE